MHTNPPLVPDGLAEPSARPAPRKLWQPGDLFHNLWRYPRKPTARRVDRVAEILRHGIVAPAMCADGAVSSDLQIRVTGTSTPYDSLVFLHRFGADSSIYTISDRGRVTLFIDPEIAVLTPADMGDNWVELCQDEVYVRDRVPVEKIISLVAHPADADSLLAELLPDFQRLGIPLYWDDGTVAWASANHSANSLQR